MIIFSNDFFTFWAFLFFRGIVQPNLLKLSIAKTYLYPYLWGLIYPTTKGHFYDKRRFYLRNDSFWVIWSEFRLWKIWFISESFIRENSNKFSNLSIYLFPSEIMIHFGCVIIKIINVIRYWTPQILNIKPKINSFWRSSTSTHLPWCWRLKVL